MAIREDIVSSAVTFLQDPNVAGSPIENRVAFLQSKNLTQEEVDVALARAGPPSASNYSSYAPQQHSIPQSTAGYGRYNPYQGQHTPPELPKRDWRDWFIMATVMGGVGYGLYFVAKRYVLPMVAPPTPPQLEQDKKAIDESFEKAFALLDQLAKDTDQLKESEKARTERLDTALTEVESVIGDLKTASRRREDESRRISDEVRLLKDLIPKAMEGEKEKTDARLRELNNELKSLKTLVGQRMNPTISASSSSANGRTLGTGALFTPAIDAKNGAVNGNVNSATEAVIPKPASVSNETASEPGTSPQGRTSSPFNTGAPAGRATIPSWQMVAATKSTNGVNSRDSGSSSLEASGSS